MKHLLFILALTYMYLIAMSLVKHTYTQKEVVIQETVKVELL